MSVGERVFDPQGDVVFILYRYPEDEDDLASDASSPAVSNASTGSLHDDTGPLGDSDIPVLETKDEKDLDIPKEDTPYREVQRWSERKSATSEVHTRVSSRHVILASRNFRDMLGNDNFEEGQTLRSEGKLDVPLPEDNPDTFIILLTLVDKYSLLEAVELFSDLWIDNVKDEEPMPESFTDDVPSWLVISWVFQKPEEFKAMSRIIEHECDERLEDMFGDDLPVVPFILQTLKYHREEAIESAINVMHDLITKYFNSDKLLCPHHNENQRFSCDGLVLGALLKDCIPIRIWPKPTAPKPG